MPPNDTSPYHHLPTEFARDATPDELRADRLENARDLGLCVTCADQGIEAKATHGEHCAECAEFGPACPTCNGYGTADGKPAAAFVGGAWGYRAEPGACGECGGSGCARDVAAMVAK